MNRTSRILTIALLALLATGCDTPPKNSDNDAYGDSAFCDETMSLLGSTSEVSSLTSMSADEILLAAGEELSVDAWYGDDQELLPASLVGTETSLTIGIAYNGGEIREIDSTPIEGRSMIGVECEPRIEIDVELSVSTTDGAFDETWNGVVSAFGVPSAALVPYLSAEFDHSGFNGSFEIEEASLQGADATYGLLTAEIQPAPNGPGGEIAILQEHSHGSGDDGIVSQSIYSALMFGDWYW